MITIMVIIIDLATEENKMEDIRYEIISFDVTKLIMH